MRSRAPGLALLLVVGVLGVLGALAASFVSLAQMERRAARQRLHATRALLLARAGLEDALARLESGQDPLRAPVRYAGEDWDADGVQSQFERQQEILRPSALDTWGCPVRHALRPSFFVSDGGGLPRYLPVQGVMRGYSGSLEGEGVYSLKVEARGGFHVNGGNPAYPAADGYNAVLRRILGTLCEALDREDGTPGNGPVSEADGFNLIDARPAGGWQNLEQIRVVALGGSATKLEALRDYLILDAWVDRKVIRPNATAALKDVDFKTWADIRLGALTEGGAPTRGAPGFEELGGRVVGRAPVSLAWARSRRPALIALVAGLEGLYLDPSTGCCLLGGDLIGTLRPAALSLNWANGTDECREIADQILSATSELAAWQQWSAFCDALTITGTSGDPLQAKRDLLKANFNPNTALNKFNPDPSVGRASTSRTSWPIRPNSACFPCRDSGCRPADACWEPPGNCWRAGSSRRIAPARRCA